MDLNLKENLKNTETMQKELSAMAVWVVTVKLLLPIMNALRLEIRGRVSPGPVPPWWTLPTRHSFVSNFDLFPYSLCHRWVIKQSESSACCNAYLILGFLSALHGVNNHSLYTTLVRKTWVPAGSAGLLEDQTLLPENRPFQRECALPQIENSS